MLCEAKGVPIGLSVEEARRHDMKLAPATLVSIPVGRPTPRKGHRQHLCLDKAYDFPEIKGLAHALGYTPHIRPRGEKTEEIVCNVAYKARRWVVERTHSWMNRFRGISIRWEKKTENYMALLHLTCAIIAFRQVGLCG